MWESGAEKFCAALGNVSRLLIVEFMGGLPLLVIRSFLSPWVFLFLGIAC